MECKENTTRISVPFNQSSSHFDSDNIPFRILLLPSTKPPLSVRLAPSHNTNSYNNLLIFFQRKNHLQTIQKLVQPTLQNSLMHHLQGTHPKTTQIHSDQVRSTSRPCIAQTSQNTPTKRVHAHAHRPPPNTEPDLHMLKAPLKSSSTQELRSLTEPQKINKSKKSAHLHTHPELHAHFRRYRAQRTIANPLHTPSSSHIHKASNWKKSRVPFHRYHVREQGSLTCTRRLPSSSMRDIVTAPCSGNRTPPTPEL
jgi:hypothetical protein